MTNFYVTYTLADKKARDEFYADIKAEAVVSKSLAEDGCIRYTYFFPADNDYQIFCGNNGKVERRRKRIQDSRILRNWVK